MDTQHQHKNIYDYMHALPIEGVKEGIDALTVTATGLDGKLSQTLILRSMEDELAVERKKFFKFQGATGWARGSVRYAEKFDTARNKLWSILMVTGPASEKALKEALKVKDVKFTRIDLCIDVFMSGKVLGLARKLKDTYKGDCHAQLIESLTGDTVYFGSRQSESYIRIYDKSPEYGEDLGRVWRFEVECKKGLATLAARYVSEQGRDAISDMVWSECRRKDVPSPIPGKLIRLKREAVTLSSAEMKLNWLSSQVAPTVRHLCSLGLREKVVRAIQLELPT